MKCKCLVIDFSGPDFKTEGYEVDEMNLLPNGRFLRLINYNKIKVSEKLCRQVLFNIISMINGPPFHESHINIACNACAILVRIEMYANIPSSHLHMLRK